MGHLPGVLPLASQQALLEMAFAMGGKSRASGTSGGWYRLEPGGTWSLNDGTKARFWDSVSEFPSGFRELGLNLARLAAHCCDTIQCTTEDFQPRVGALNYYTTRGRMGWHADDYNFAKKD